MGYSHRRKQPFRYKGGKTALIAVLKAPGDLAAARDHWYRIPLKNAPKHAFTHIAFYQPACFKPEGKRIACYARVTGRSTCRRIDLFPGEPAHPAANRFYLKYSLGRLIKLPRPVLNTSGTRVVFGYAPLSRLKRAADLPAVFNTVPVENLMCAALKAAGLPFRREHVILHRRRCKYRLDFALFCKRGRLDIECDGRRFHGNPAQHAKDVYRDKWLKRHGWATLRFGEHEIYSDVAVCLGEINTAIAFYGGLKSGVK
jgi:very-short-patch-repair endonuclease